MFVEQRLKDLEIELPAVNPPSAAYVPYREHNNIAYISGQAPRINGNAVITGKVGNEVTADEAYNAARICALNIIAHLKHNLGDLDRIKSVLYVRGYVACTSDFYNHPSVINGASELLESVFGKKGKHARCAVGVASLPGNIPVEVECTVAFEQFF